MIDDKEKYESRNKIIDQHFWFTATALGLNGYLISGSEKIDYSLFTVIWISFLNLYICFLIIQRSAYHAGKIKTPKKIKKKSQSERDFIDKFKETQVNIITSIKHIPFITAEFSGTLLYLLLVITGYIGFLSICFF
ncbi:MAG: hypothetical protein WDZ45_02115 [Flavobacteriaceae bacterium]